MMIAAMHGDLAGIPIDPFHPKLRQYLLTSMGSLPDEVLRILFLDGTQRLIADEQLQSGSLAQLAIYPRTLFRRALELNAAAMILIHNHPSGDPTPSADDLRVTRRLTEIGQSLDIEILDHIIVTAAHLHHIVKEPLARTKICPADELTLRSFGRKAAPDAVLENVRSTIRRRILRKQLIGTPDLFGEPAWEMLLDLFLHECEGKDLSITSLCVTASIPMSSALRLAQKLCDAQILVRAPDPLDGRRSFVRLEPEIRHRMLAFFGEVSE